MRSIILMAVLAAACGGRSVVFTPPPSNAVRVYVDVGEEGGWTGQAVSAFRDEAECRDASVYPVGQQQAGAHYRMALGDRDTRFEAGVEVTLYDGRGDLVYSGRTFRVSSSVKDTCESIAAHLANGAELVTFN